MLVLSRKPGESLIIGDQIKITVVRVQGNRVKLGIEAPANCRVLRAELSGWHTLEDAHGAPGEWRADWSEELPSSDGMAAAR